MLITVGYRPDKKTPSEATLQYFDEVHAKTPPSSPPPERPDSPLQNCTQITALPTSMQDWLLARYPNVRAKLGLNATSSGVSNQASPPAVLLGTPTITVTNHSRPVETSINTTIGNHAQPPAVVHTQPPAVVVNQPQALPTTPTGATIDELTAPAMSSVSVARKALFPSDPTDAEMEQAMELFYETLAVPKQEEQTTNR